MTTPTTPPKPTNQDPLAALTFTAVEGATPGPEEPQDKTESQAFAAIEAGLEKIIYFGLRALRTAIAKKMPEINDEWTDDLLKGPSAAAVPLVRKHLDSIMQIAGQNPELAMLAISVIPLALGYVAAIEKHSKTVQDVPVKNPASGSAPESPHNEGMGHE
jgi:hypothetical protein